MPAPILLVHTSADLLSRTAALLQQAGHEVATYTNPLEALRKIKLQGRLRVLVTRLMYPEGQPNGISMAQVTLHHRPSARVIFTVQPEFLEHVDFGRVLLEPVTAEQLAHAVLEALEGQP